MLASIFNYGYKILIVIGVIVILFMLMFPRQTISKYPDYSGVLDNIERVLSTKLDSSGSAVPQINIKLEKNVAKEKTIIREQTVIKDDKSKTLNFIDRADSNELDSIRKFYFGY